MEESPKKLLVDYRCPTLEDVFFKLSEAQSKKKNSIDGDAVNLNNPDEISDTVNFDQSYDPKTSTETLVITENSSEVCSGEKIR